MSLPPDAVADFGLGFRSVTREYVDVDLPLEGGLPGWLDGCLLRNGPGRFEVGDERVAHWFDGLAMLARFGFSDGMVSYTNRFLRSREYRSMTEQGELAGGQFGTANGGLVGRLRDWLLPTVTDNANVNVLPVGGRHVAITETQLGVEFDPDTLATLGGYTFDDFEGQTMCAHPHIDPKTGETVTFTTDYGRRSRYRFYRSPAGSERFRAIGTIPTERPAYVHSFGLTSDHVVLVEFPLDVHPLRLLLPGGDAFIERFQWRPEQGTRFHVLDRQSGARVGEHVAEAAFAFHHVNAFEADDSLIVDIAAFDGPSVVDALFLEDLTAGRVPSLDGELRRYRLPVEGDGRVRAETLHPEPVTLPRISPARNTQPYRYVYAQGAPDPDVGLPQRLVKVDLHEGGATSWSAPDTYWGEPVFVPGPAGSAEDDGVVLSVGLDAAIERSKLLVLDGESFEPLAEAPLPHVVPFDFHGQYLAEG